MNNTHDEHTDEQWENGDLGASAEYVRKIPAEQEQTIDNALGLQVISLRLQKELIENLKSIAVNEGIGYQPLIRQVLTHYVRDTLRGHGRLRHAG